MSESYRVTAVYPTTGRMSFLCTEGADLDHAIEEASRFASAAVAPRRAVEVHRLVDGDWRPVRRIEFPEPPIKRMPNANG